MARWYIFEQCLRFKGIFSARLPLVGSAVTATSNSQQCALHIGKFPENFPHSIFP